MERTITRINELATRKDRFTYDLRGDCLVYSGIVAAYRATQDSTKRMELLQVIDHALANDGMVGSWVDAEGKRCFDSCRLFTDAASALDFARKEGQRSVYNLNREEEIEVREDPRAA